MEYQSSLSSRLNRRAVLMKNGVGTERDALGQYPQRDEEVAQVWAGVTPQTGGLLAGRAADTQLSRTTHKVIIRYRPDVTPDMWLMVEGVRYEILYILDPYLRHERLELFCEVRQ